MIGNSLYAKYKNYKISSQREPNEFPPERLYIIVGINLGITFLLSLSTYILTFFGVINNNFNSIIFSNSSIHSILTPLTRLQYFQFVTYITFVFHIFMYIFKCGNKDTLLKSYDMAHYIIPINIFQIINNLFSFDNSTIYIMYSFSNIIITSIIITLFTKVQLSKHPAPFLKVLTIDVPVICYYQATIINIIFAINQILYYTDNSLIYNENVFFGLMLILFIINTMITLSIKHIFQNALYILLMICYFAKTFNLEELNTNIKNTTSLTLSPINNDTIYNMRISIVIPTMLNIIMICICSIHYCRDNKKQNNKKQIEQIEQIDELKEQIL